MRHTAASEGPDVGADGRRDPQVLRADTDTGTHAESEPRPRSLTRDLRTGRLGEIAWVAKGARARWVT